MNSSPQLPPSQSDDVVPYVSAIPVESSNVSESKFRLDKILAMLRRFWWIPVITVILAAGIGAAMIFKTPPSYISQATMWETEKFRLPEGAVFTENVQTALGTHIELLKSGRISELAVELLKTKGSNAIPVGADGKPLSVKFNAWVDQKSSVIAASVTSADPNYSQNYLNAVLNAFLSYRKNARKSVSGETLTSISDQVLRLERDLKASQDALTSFERTNNLAIIQEESSQMGSYLTKLKLQLSDLRLESELLNSSIADQQTAQRSNTLALTSTEGAAGHDITAPQMQAMKDLQVLIAERDRLSKKLRPKHPKIVKLNTDIERAQKLVDIFRKQTIDQLASSRETLSKKIASVQKNIEQWEPKVTEATAHVAEADQLKLNVSRAQSIYDRFANLYQNADVSRNIDQETLAILDNASPGKRLYDTEKKIAAITLFAGLGVGLGIIAFLTYRDDKIVNSVDVVQNLNSAIVGQLPELPKIKGEKTLTLISPNDQRYAYAESYRNLRSALLFQAVDGERPQIIMVTSAVPGEGKSTVAANLATTMAMGGSRVLLIDADMRLGKLHTLLQAQADPGLAEVLSKKAVVDRVIQSTNLPNLSFIGRGAQGLNPSDLFLSESTKQLFDFLRTKFDHIIIDTSPVFASDDATTLAPMLDGTLFVVRGKHSEAGVARKALELLHQRQVKILGVVFNGVDTTGFSGYSKYYRS